MSDWRNIGLDANRLRQLYDEARAEVSSLRTERDRYREALGNLFDMATEFSTQADYTVEGGIESDFSEALDDARAALAQQEGEQETDDRP